MSTLLSILPPESQPTARQERALQVVCAVLALTIFFIVAYEWGLF